MSNMKSVSVAITFEIDLESGDWDGDEVGMRLIRRGTCLSVCLFQKFGTYSSKTDISRMFRFFPPFSVSRASGDAPVHNFHSS